MYSFSLSQHIPSSRRVLDNGLDFSIVVAEADVVCAVLLHGDGPLEWPITNGQLDVVGSRLLDALGGLVRAVACNNLSIDL